MSSNKEPRTVDAEIDAIGIVYRALKSLNKEAQVRVMQYVKGKLGVEFGLDSIDEEQQNRITRVANEIGRTSENDASAKPVETGTELADGISPIAQKWIRRSGLTVEQLNELFSIGGEEIDLIAKSVPGKAKKGKLLNVILLKGIAAYLASGAARVSYQPRQSHLMLWQYFAALEKGKWSGLDSFGG